MTQHEKILSLLANGEWICTNSFYASYIADPRTRIVELKKKGYLLEWRWCQTHSHNKSKEWRLIGQNLPNSARSEELMSKTIYSMSSPPQTPQHPLFAYQPLIEH